MTQGANILTRRRATGLVRVSNKTVPCLARDGALAGAIVDCAWRFLRVGLLDHVHRGSGHDIERPDLVT